MAYTVSSEKVRTANAAENVDSSGNSEGKGGFVAGTIDFTSYTNGGETVRAYDLGLAVLYGVQFFAKESSAYVARSSVVAANGQTVVLTVDNVGTGTETTNATDIGEFIYVAFGERTADNA